MKSNVERLRKAATFVAASVWVLAALAIESSWGEDSPIGWVLFGVGCVLSSCGVVGRLWCLSFIAGHKTRDLVTVGPYSLCRNPLYFFSLVGAVGVGLASCTLVLPLLVLLGFGLYYPQVIRSEARRLAETHGDAFVAYVKSTPCLMPAFGGYREGSGEQIINTNAFRKGLFDGVWFLLAFGAMHLLAEMHHSKLVSAWIVLW